MKKNFILLCLLMSTLHGFGQDSLINALKKDLEKTDNNETKMTTAARLAALLRIKDESKAGFYADMALECSRRSKAYNEVSDVWKNIFRFYRTCKPGQKQKALDSTLYYAKKSNDNRALGNAYYLEGYNESNEDESTAMYFKAIDYLQKANADREIAIICYELTGTYGMSKNIENEETYARKALYHAERSANADALCLAGLAMSTYFRAAFEKDTTRHSYLDSCVFFLKKCIATFEANEQNCEIRFSGYTAAVNLADCYYVFFHINR